MKLNLVLEDLIHSFENIMLPFLEKSGVCIIVNPCYNTIYVVKLISCRPYQAFPRQSGSRQVNLQQLLQSSALFPQVTLCFV